MIITDFAKASAVLKVTNKQQPPISTAKLKITTPPTNLEGSAGPSLVSLAGHDHNLSSSSYASST